MEQEKVICVNGSFMAAPEAVIPVLDGALLYGQGLFETILIKNGKPELLEKHLKRLARSSGELAIALSFTMDELSGMLDETIKRSGCETGAARLTLTAGVEGGKSNCIIHMRPLPYKQEHYVKGFKAGFLSIRKNERSPLAGHKTTSFFENILARREARARGLDEGIFLNTLGQVAEGSVSNIFFVKDETVITPDIESGPLPGIMRGKVMEICRQKGIQVEERKVLPGELQGCEEAFITNSLLGVMPLVNIDNRTLGGAITGEITGLLMKELQVSLY
jgi:branched-subunit amino acid aminotransferase/4-amino-4-deoxychorismate lyase